MSKHVKRITLPKDFYSEHGIPETPPVPGSLFWTMWEACQDIAKEALATGYIQGIGNGNLDPKLYGSYTVMDAYYCFRGAEDYRDAAAKTYDPTLKAFLNHKYQSYHSYNQSFKTEWGLKDASGINPNKAVKDYSDLEHEVVVNEDPIYSLIVMLPCEYLWYWLSDQLKGNVENNLYGFWITGNLDPSGAYAMGNYINMYQKHYPKVIEEANALNIYRQAMQGELSDFKARSGGKNSLASYS